MKKKIFLLSVLLFISISTVAFLTLKYISTVRTYNQFYRFARETAERIDAETERLESEITVLQDSILSLNTQLETVTAQRDELAGQLMNLP